MARSGTSRFRKSYRLRLGYVPLADAAPLIVARALGLFERYGLAVELTREVGWATIRDKIIYGELEAAHAVAGLVFACSEGWGCLPTECLTALVLNLNGNAITISQRLYQSGVRHARDLRQFIAQNRQPLILGVASLVSSHHFLMRQWLRSGGLNPGNEIRLVVVPPPQMTFNLQHGYIDAFCVGEPWNSVAVMRGEGVCVATSEDLAPGHPEKVLVVRKSFAEERGEEHLALVAALLEACAFCDQPENRERLIEVLAAELPVPIEALRRSMLGRFYFTRERSEKIPNLNVFARFDANKPTPQKAEWVLRALRSSGLLGSASEDQATHRFRLDLFGEAARLVETENLLS